MTARQHPALLVLSAAALLALPAAPAAAWHAEGHAAMTRLAVRSMPADVPEFFRASGEVLAVAVADPDVFRRPAATPALHAAEAPEHYFDLEFLQGRAIPPTRYEFIALCAEMGLTPEKAGLLPYAIQETTARLAIAFAQHRRWGDDPLIRSKCLLYAALLAHYSQDLCQPLHVTIHHRGRVQDDGTTAASDIHQRMDALIGKLPRGWETSAATGQIHPLEDLHGQIVSELLASHALVDAVYELQPLLPGADEPLDDHSPAAEMAKGRALAGASFTARLYLTAWRMSETIALPDWAPAPPGPPVEAAAAPDSSQWRAMTLTLAGMAILAVTMFYRRARMARAARGD